ncbi:MAG: putative baseplate assembly protein [Polyangiales bacterium]
MSGSSRCCGACAPSTPPCGCCAGIAPSTPVAVDNREGLDALDYRVGTHATFFASMRASIATLTLGTPQPGAEHEAGGARPLAALTSRDASDFSIALMDAAAVVCDVLTFYQERIANEGFLRTATERRSLVELGKLVGYSLKAGLSASTYLAYTIDDNTKEDVLIPAGAKAQTIPGPGELPQVFETGEDLVARAAWNRLTPRTTEPPQLGTIELPERGLYLVGITTQLKANDMLLAKQRGAQKLLRVLAVEPEPDKQRTRVVVGPWVGTTKPPQGKTARFERAATSDGEPPVPREDPYLGWVRKLAAPPARPLANAAALRRNLDKGLNARSDAGVRFMAAGLHVGERLVADALRGQAAESPRDMGLEIYAMRVKTGLFGRAFPPELPADDANPYDWEFTVGEDEEENILFLDGNHPSVLPGSTVVLDHRAAPDSPALPNVPDRIHAITVTEVAPKIVRRRYGMAAESTRLVLERSWLASSGSKRADFDIIRMTTVYAQSERLEVAPSPVAETVFASSAQHDYLELEGLYTGLEPGRFVLVSGIRADLAIPATEAVMIDQVIHDVRDGGAPVPYSTGEGQKVPLAGDLTHTFVSVFPKLRYTYRRESVGIHANVVRATHGETRDELLGSGSASKSGQRFALKQKPLTSVASPTARGAESTLRVYVNDVRWDEVPTFVDVPADARAYVTQEDDDDVTTVTFGDGLEGLRLPTGTGNVRARYRSGTGRAGNARAGQVSILGSRPLGVREVINPLRASGGADRESVHRARTSIPTSVLALDRLVAVSDYAAYARNFAGIDKADARELVAGGSAFVHLTVAGMDDIPIEPDSDLHRNLHAALHTHGDPLLSVRIAPRELHMLVLAARVQIAPDHLWVVVSKALRARLLESFSFARRDLSQPLYMSDLLRVMHDVRGVAYVDLDAFGAVPTMRLDPAAPGSMRPATSDELSAAVADILKTPIMADALEARAARVERGVVLPAQLIALSPELPESLVLNQIEEGRS